MIKIRRFGLGINAQAYWNAVTTDVSGAWTLRFTVAGLFPSRRDKPHRAAAPLLPIV